MMNRDERKLTAAELIEIVSAGGWMTRGGYVWKEPDQPVLEVTLFALDGDVLHIVSRDGTIVWIPTDRIVQAADWKIEIWQDSLQREQRKKVDGGGWHEVMRPGIALRLVHPEMNQEFLAGKQEDKRRREAARQARAEEEKQRAAAELEERRMALLGDLTGKYVGRTITGLSVSVDRLEIIFDNGTRLDIDVGGEGYDGWPAVNGVGLRYFDQREY